MIISEIKPSIKIFEAVDALATLASVKNKADEGKNVAKAGYLFYQASPINEVADNQSFEEAQVVKQVTTCRSTLESLQEAISNNSNSSEALEDVEAVKMIATKENNSKMQ